MGQTLHHCRTNLGEQVKIAELNEREVDDAVGALTSLMEPFIMAVLGILIGGLVVAMYLPVFRMGSVV
ncbi:MAG: hypothetical protein GAK35_04322 [Herbaspirillum frisingense]|uniref:Type II secretion system protein GspF domain-containing protein n=1 Tax=Herbaspirillum frisingense TaxID=92645 RepID=A0A7V8JS01_9BURK|nr:MAG: hypothetical protein GAK35_04322 [Herbaspirillum frisingense]